MKILQIFGAVVAVHLLAFIFIFASPGCSSNPRNPPTPDATMPGPGSAQPSPSYGSAVAPQPVDLGTPPPAYSPMMPTGQTSPTRPGSANAAAVTPPAPSPKVATTAPYTVERGDSLWSIAKKHGTTVAELAKINRIPTSTALKPGRKLLVPAKEAEQASAATAAPGTGMLPVAEKSAAVARPANGEATTHVVRSGESLGVIARKYGVSTGELAAVNTITDISKVRAGQTLIIPNGKGGAPKSATASATPKPASGPAASTASKPPGATTGPGASAATTPPAETTAPVNTPHFDLTPPPQGQDLDAGLKPTETEVPTLKVEEATPGTPK